MSDRLKRNIPEKQAERVVKILERLHDHDDNSAKEALEAFVEAKLLKPSDAVDAVLTTRMVPLMAAMLISEILDAILKRC